MMELYKVLNEDGSAIYGAGSWNLPTDKPGKWMPEIEGDLVVCKNGYHLCRRQDLVQWLGPVIYAVDYDGEMIEADNKVVVRRARLISCVDAWTEKTARLFAADCAERALRFWDRQDDRPKLAIEAARAFANGQITKDKLAAARDAARDAAWAAARAATWDAARDAAWDAAGAAAWDAARAAARDAARAAAWAAAWDATRDAARDAAGAAARDAARAAARAAAWDAEHEWQADRLFEYLEGKA